jgi:hypothetical protein
MKYQQLPSASIQLSTQGHESPLQYHRGTTPTQVLARGNTTCKGNPTDEMATAEMRGTVLLWNVVRT